MMKCNPHKPEEEKEIQEIIAQAIYSEDDKSLTFVKTNQQKKGETYDDKTITEVYTGFETNNNNNTSIPWYAYRSEIQSVVVKDEIKPQSTAHWFTGFSNCTVFDLQKLDTSNVISMEYMFYNCSGLTQIDVSNWNTSNVSNMSNMFSGCNSLTQINTSNWDTSNVTKMNFMFAGANKVSVDCSKWNVKNVTDYENFKHYAPSVIEPNWVN